MKDLMKFAASSTGAVLAGGLLIAGAVWYTKRATGQAFDKVGEVASAGADAITPWNNSNIVNRSLSGGVTLIKDVLDDGEGNGSVGDFSLGASIYEMIHGENG